MRKSEKSSVLARQAALVATLFLSTAVTGCASIVGLGNSDFSCPEREQGVACHSVQDIYKHTEDRDQLSNADFAEPGKGGDKDSGNESRQAVEQRPGPHLPTVPAVDGPLPLRTPSHVMRIRLNYWESDDGNLHVPGYVYTEIEPRRWQVGLHAPGAAKMLHPLQIVQPTAARPSGEPRRKNGTSMSAQQAARQQSGQ